MVKRSKGEAIDAGGDAKVVIYKRIKPKTVQALDEMRESMPFTPIRLVRKAGFEFASKRSDYIDPQNALCETHQWTLSQPLGTATGGGLSIVINPGSIQFEIAHPTHRAEWLETRCTMVLQEFFDK